MKIINNTVVVVTRIYFCVCTCTIIIGDLVLPLIYCTYVGIYCTYVGIYCTYVGIYCTYVGIYCTYICRNILYICRNILYIYM